MGREAFRAEQISRSRRWRVYAKDGMEISQAAEAVLAELARCDSNLMHNEAAQTVNLYDGDAAVRGFGKRVEVEIFVYLRDNKLIARTEAPDPQRGPGLKQYKINEAGRAALR
jgi:hypothetical protein